MYAHECVQSREDVIDVSRGQITKGFAGIQDIMKGFMWSQTCPSSQAPGGGPNHGRGPRTSPWTAPAPPWRLNITLSLIHTFIYVELAWVLCLWSLICQEMASPYWTSFESGSVTPQQPKWRIFVGLLINPSKHFPSLSFELEKKSSWLSLFFLAYTEQKHSNAMVFL